MKTLTVRQPFAHLIATGVKSIENRAWPTAHRGPLLIHAAKNTDPRDAATLTALEDRGIVFLPADLIYGAIIAVVDVVDCLRYNDLSRGLADDPFAFGEW